MSIIVLLKKRRVGHSSSRLQSVNVTGVINVQTIRQMNESLTELIRLFLVLFRVSVTFLSK